MDRKEFLKLMAISPVMATGFNLTEFEKISATFPKSKKMPMLFLGHGHPMNAVFDNTFTRTLQQLGTQIERPNAIMMISAHWETRGTYVSVNPTPRTIYDFGGFDERLSQIKYEPKGHPTLAREVSEMASQFQIIEDHSMGLDHGAWTVLKYIFPKADIPVFQLSLDYTQPSAYHFQLAQALKRIRERGVMVIGSGNIVHNLNKVNWFNIDAKPADWAVEFDELVKQKINQYDFNTLVDYKKLGSIAALSIPTNDHYLPMLYVLAMTEKNEAVKYIYEGYQYASLSMRCFQVY
ncbi:4,5-DOPA dioxygenase extradiol [Flavobacterium sp. NRK F10]|uniref:4,5-DOPA-extradiol-dioxygenase n=1 Tax=Flavobacterium sp. NRK F10 TaxID=2954931 RepID=UPI002091E262|nr:4,5-DOPA dioxygenase extradiol [Flavobacterium sp. NRK F10]MCO6173711.1 4,5-DOPA dioxygenase extradiol [Flavobacterium sp. NRK F10]